MRPRYMNVPSPAPCHISVAGVGQLSVWGLRIINLYLIFTVTSFLKFVNTQKWWLVFGVPTMRRSNAHDSRPIQRPNDLCVMLLCCAPLPQQSYRSPVTVTAKQQRMSQGGAFDDLTRSFVVSGKLRSDTEVCTAINQ